MDVLDEVRNHEHRKNVKEYAVNPAGTDTQKDIEGVILANAHNRKRLLGLVFSRLILNLTEIRGFQNRKTNPKRDTDQEHTH